MNVNRNEVNWSERSATLNFWLVAAELLYNFLLNYPGRFLFIMLWKLNFHKFSTLITLTANLIHLVWIALKFSIRGKWASFLLFRSQNGQKYLFSFEFRCTFFRSSCDKKKTNTHLAKVVAKSFCVEEATKKKEK